MSDEIYVLFLCLKLCVLFLSMKARRSSSSINLKCKYSFGLNGNMR